MRVLALSVLYLFYWPPFFFRLIPTSNKNFILKYFRCRDGKRTETRIGMEGICITHSCIPLYTVYLQHIIITSNKNFILKYFRCRDGKRQHSTVHCVHATHNGSQWWNAGMGNTDTLHPNSCFCSFSIPTSEIF